MDGGSYTRVSIKVRGEQQEEGNENRMRALAIQGGIGEGRRDPDAG